eukprot:g1802.t1
MDRLSFSSDHVNYLILRYLQERSYSHSAYTFAHESKLSPSVFQPGEVPPGALIHIIQKGLQFIEMEANVTKEKRTTIGEYKYLHSHDLITKDMDELRQEVQTQRSKGQELMRTSPSTIVPPGRDVVMTDQHEIDEIPPDHVTTLRGHTSEVFICTWSPTEDLLASGSGDASARIWNLSESLRTQQEPVVLAHSTNGDGDVVSNKSKDVTTMDWSPDGSQLATGSYDGHARIWSKTGALLQTFRSHVGPIFSLKWNSKGTLLLSGSVDNSAKVWDVKTGDLKQSFQYHTCKRSSFNKSHSSSCSLAATLDVDWKSNSIFATCSTDHSIYVCKFGEDQPLKAFRGHENEVNAIKWDPNGKYLASCSDDTTARIWSLHQDDPVLILRDHTKEIYTVKWSPTGPGTDNPHLPLFWLCSRLIQRLSCGIWRLGNVCII